MQRRLLIALLVPSLLGVGCSGDPAAADAAPDHADATHSADAAPDRPDAATPDAALPDATPADAAFDAAPVDAAPVDADPATHATIRVVDEGTPLANVAIVVGHADGSVKAFVHTDASGRADVEVVDGDMITAAWGGPQVFSSQTIFAVAPGDQLSVDIHEPEFPDGNPLGTVTVNLPGEVPAGTAQLRATSGCEELASSTFPASAPMVLQPASDCHTSTSFPVLIRTLSGTGTVLGYQVIDVTAPTTVTPSATWSLPSAQKVFLSASNSVELAQASLRSTFILASGERFQAKRQQSINSTSISGWTIAGTPEMLERPGTRWYTSVQTIAPENNGNGMFANQLHFGTGTAVDGAFSDTDFPRRARFQQDYATPYRPVVSRNEVSSGPQATAILTQLGGSNYAWTAIWPPSQTYAQFPVLPDALAAWRPLGTQTMHFTPSQVTASFLPDYAAARHFFDQYVVGDQSLDMQLIGRRWLAKLPAEGWIAFAR